MHIVLRKCILSISSSVIHSSSISKSLSTFSSSSLLIAIFRYRLLFSNDILQAFKLTQLSSFPVGRELIKTLDQPASCESPRQADSAPVSNFCSRFHLQPRTLRNKLFASRLMSRNNLAAKYRLKLYKYLIFQLRMHLFKSEQSSQRQFFAFSLNSLPDGGGGMKTEDRTNAMEMFSFY